MCEWQRKVSAYLDGMLAPDEIAAVIAHLKVCDECRKAMTEWQQIRRQFLMESLPTSPAMIAATLERLEREGAFKTSNLRSQIQRLDLWFTRLDIAFRAAMAVAVLVTLLLANSTAPVLRARDAFQAKIQQAIRLIPLIHSNESEQVNRR
jgi:anti-sigma factor RsiW